MPPITPDDESWLEDKFKGKWISDGPTMWMCTLHKCLPLCMEVPWEHVRPLMERSICRHRKNACHPLVARKFPLRPEIWLNIIADTTLPFSIDSFWFYKTSWLIWYVVAFCRCYLHPIHGNSALEHWMWLCVISWSKHMRFEKRSS